eukprot:jgi/Ulvmu1/7467/UM037_0010.1
MEHKSPSHPPPPPSASNGSLLPQPQVRPPPSRCHPSLHPLALTRPTHSLPRPAVSLIATVACCAWALDRAGPAGPAFPANPEPGTTLTKAIRNDATNALTSHIRSHLLLQPSPPDPADPASPAETPPDATTAARPSPSWAAWVATNTTIHPAYAANALTVNIPPATASSLLRLQIFGMDTACDITAQMCLCGASDALPPLLQAAVPQVSKCPPIDCAATLLQPILMLPSDAYDHQHWYKLLLPCTLLPDRAYTIEWVSQPAAAFASSAPYDDAADSTNAVEGGNGDGQPLPNVAVLARPKAYLPSTLERGAEAAFTQFTVTAPAALTVLTGTEASGMGAMHDGGMRTQGFKSMQGVSSNMLVIVVGALQRLATGYDAYHRPVSVWALPGGTPEDAQVPWQLLSNATAAWADFTGQPLPSLGKLDMVVWNGDSPWSMSQHGLLLMDRFRTLWRGGASTATDLVRAAHVICHETGHLWFGGLLQTLNATGKAFVEESTTSYGEVFCVSAVLLGPLSVTEAFARSYFAAFGDTRGLHIGASFHATSTLAQPAHADDYILGGSWTDYTKGPAMLHMLESYMDAAVMPGLMHEAVRGFFRTYAHKAITATDLLCYLAHVLAGCPVGAAGSDLQCEPPPAADAAAAAVAAAEAAAAGSRRNGTALAQVETGSSCGNVPPWLLRLQAWLVEPGVQVVEVHQSDMAAAASSDAAGGAAELQALLLPNEIPGQSHDGAPLWIPVSLVSSADSPAAGADNSTAPRARGQRWLEVFPPWEDSHRTALGGEGVCVEMGRDGGGEQCSRPLASPPLTVQATGSPWLPKARAAPFLVSLPDQGMQAAVVRQLRQFKLSGGGLEVGTAHPDLPALQAFSTLLHDTHTLFTAAPTAPRYAFLRQLLDAAFSARATYQAGLGAYLLLGPATTALWELQLLARGDRECSNKVAGLEKSLIANSGAVAWKRLLPRAKNDKGDPSTLTQDELFTRAIAARLVPRAVRYDSDLAESVCSLLQSPPSDATLQQLLKTIGHTPDVQNIVLEAALATPKSCNASTTVQKALVSFLKSPVSSTGLLPHTRRSASFILATSHDRETLQFVMDAAVLGEDDSVDSGIRKVDRSILFHRIARNSLVGFTAAAEIMQEYGEGVDEWDASAAFLAEMAPWTVTGSDASLPEWLQLDQLQEARRDAVVLQKQADTAAAQIVCATGQAAKA